MKQRDFEKFLEYLRAVLAWERTCVHCGCRDSRACPGGCAWVIEHAATPTGVCSSPACMRKEKKQAGNLPVFASRSPRFGKSKPDDVARRIKNARGDGGRLHALGGKT